MAQFGAHCEQPRRNCSFDTVQAGVNADLTRERRLELFDLSLKLNSEPFTAGTSERVQIVPRKRLRVNFGLASI